LKTQGKMIVQKPVENVDNSLALSVASGLFYEKLCLKSNKMRQKRGT